MVLFDILKAKRHFLLTICAAAGILAGGAAMMYLFTIPDVVHLAALQISQVYVFAIAGITFFAANLGSAVALFVKEVILKDIIKKK